MINPTDDQTVNGDRLLAAMASITDAAFNKRYLIKLEPAYYTVTSALVLKPWVDIEGSGWASEITSNASLPTATVIGATNSELRDVAVSQTGNNTDYAVAMTVNNASVKLHDVRLNASGGPEAVALDAGAGSSLRLYDSELHASHYSVPGTAIGYRQSGGGADFYRTLVSVFAGPYTTYGIVANAGSLDLIDSEVAVFGPNTGLGEMNAIVNHAPAVTRVRNSSVSAGQGSISSAAVRIDGGSVVIDRSNLSTNGTYSVVQTGPSGFVDIATTGLSRLPTALAANIRCVFAYRTDTYAALNADCG